MNCVECNAELNVFDGVNICKLCQINNVIDNLESKPKKKTRKEKNKKR